MRPCQEGGPKGVYAQKTTETNPRTLPAGVELPVHSHILAQRSGVWRAMLVGVREAGAAGAGERLRLEQVGLHPCCRLQSVEHGQRHCTTLIFGVPARRRTFLGNHFRIYRASCAACMTPTARGQRCWRRTGRRRQVGAPAGGRSSLWLTMLLGTTLQQHVDRNRAGACSSWPPWTIELPPARLPAAQTEALPA